MDYQSLLELVQKRRSTRSFKRDPIPDEYVDKIIEAARWAPSGANSQPWEFVVVKKQELRQGIVKLFEEQLEITYKMEQTREPEQRYLPYASAPQGPPGFAAAPVFIILCGDPRTKDAYPLNAVFEHAQTIFDSSLASAFLYMHLASTSLGLGSQWITSTAMPLMQCRLKKLLEIPPAIQIYDMMALGYPESEPKPRLVRALDEMVHYDHCDKGKLRTDQQVTDFIAAARRR